MAAKRRMTRDLARNRAPGGRDWIVGDVHGCFRTLSQVLHGIDFEHGRDRLFSVGDLIDRGPNSVEALEWLEGDCFDAVVMGNHEAEMVRHAADGRDSLAREAGISNGCGTSRGRTCSGGTVR